MVWTVVFAVFVAVSIYGSFEEIGFDPGFPRSGQLGDFGSFYESGRAATRGEDPYGIYPLTYFAAAGPAGAARNLNAPFSVLLFEPLTLLEPTAAARLWNIGAAIAYVAAVLLLHFAYPARRAPWRLIWAFGISSLWGTLALGQIYTFLALAATGAWLLLERGRDREGAVLIGAFAAIKPNFFIWPLVLLVAGHRRAAISALLAAAAFSALPLVALGPRVYFEWFNVVLTNTPDALVTNGALSAVVTRLALPTWVALVMSLALIAFVAVWAWRSGRPVARLNGAALTATLLASPLAWTGYSLVLIPIFFAQAFDIFLGLAALLLLVPVGSVLLPVSRGESAVHLILASTYTVTWLLVLTATVRAGRRKTPAAETPMGSLTDANDAAR